MDVITHDEYAAVFSWKGDILEEYWYCILDALIQPEDYGKVHRNNLIVDDGGDITLLIHEGKNVDNLFLKDDTIPESISTENVESNIVQTIINHQLEGRETEKWNKICQYVYGSF